RGLTTLRALMEDAYEFVHAFSSSIASNSTPHIYISQLQLWPRDRMMHEHYGYRLKKFTNASHDGHTSFVLSVAYSRDGAYIASGSYDNTIRIWDARTGKPVGQPLTGHTDSVNSVAYSPDGAYIASGSWDKTIRIWDVRAGKPVGQPLTGHTYRVWSVAYSPDGAYIASGSGDQTIRIWNARTGEPVGQPLTGHTHWVNSVAYSPDGAYVASGSYDCTIRIWDAYTGKPVGQPLTGHAEMVWSAAYSPDGAYIASGSDDNTVRIWDARTGKPVGQPLTGHTDWVNSVAYSPDGAYIVSGSRDETIRIWFAPSWPEPKPVQPSTPSRRPATEPFRRSFWTVLKSTNQTTRRFQPNRAYKGDNKLKQQAAAIPPITASPLDWTLNEDGWVLGLRQERLIWVPPDLRDQVAPPKYKAIISAEKPSVTFDFHEAKLGLEWHDCYNPS
ncbi:POC1 centriolar protein A, partial [Ceratobasidium sp. 395]